MSQSVRDLINSLSNGGIERAIAYRPARARAIRARSGRTLKRRTISADDNYLNLNTYMNNQTDNKIFLGVNDFDDLITSEILKRRVDANQRTLHRDTTVLANRRTWANWVEQNFDGDLIVQGGSSSGFIVIEATNEYITYSVSSNSTNVRAYGSQEFVTEIIEMVEDAFSVVTSHIEWVYGSDGHSVSVPLNRDRLPVAEMYPFLNGESLESYYDRYMNSSANILLLIGPPGTGKTTFIRGLLSHRNASAIVSYDSQILEKDGFFARFIEDDTEIMVLEDSDAFLKSRSDGNTMMHRFLNVGDGLVTTRGKKMIFSTNLPSIRDVDSALVRPGRCFDIVTFDQLDTSQAKVLADKLGVAAPTDSATGKYSIAEIFNKQSDGVKNSKNSRKVGFY